MGVNWPVIDLVIFFFFATHLFTGERASDFDLDSIEFRSPPPSPPPPDKNPLSRRKIAKSNREWNLRQILNSLFKMISRHFCASFVSSLISFYMSVRRSRDLIFVVVTGKFSKRIGAISREERSMEVIKVSSIWKQHLYKWSSNNPFVARSRDFSFTRNETSSSKIHI